jgi:hypothetical protein
MQWMGCGYMRDEMNKILTPEEILEIESLGINIHSDLLDPKVDIVFKAIKKTSKD